LICWQGSNYQEYAEIPKPKIQTPNGGRFKCRNLKSKVPDLKRINYIIVMNLEKPYDLGDRTFLFALNVSRLVNKLPSNLSNIEYSKQVIKSSGSVGANYIEANENLGDKDAIYRFKVCRKEAKESAFWLRLLKATNDESFYQEFDKQIQEANELKMIFNSIVSKKSGK
jgi:four helix bundle protein